MTSTAKFVSTRRPLIIHFVFDRSRELLVRQKDTLKNEYGEPLRCHITKLKYLTDVGVMRFRTVSGRKRRPALLSGTWGLANVCQRLSCRLTSRVWHGH